MPLVHRLLAAAVLALATSACSGESGTAADPGVGNVTALRSGAPRSWFGINARLDLYDVGTDTGLRRSGATSAYLRSRTSAIDTLSFVGFGQALSALSYRGKRVRLSGYVRADSVTGGGAGLWMRIDAPTATVGFDNMIGFGRQITGTTGWLPYSVVLDVPMEAVGITIGALFKGRGTVRIDDVTFEVVDSSVPTTGFGGRTPTGADSASVTNSYLRNPSTPSNLDFEGTTALPVADAAAVAWLAANARPFATDAPTSGFDDLAEIGTIVGTARVVALGEATHGTREFFRMKHRTFEYLVERHGFTHFTIEATMPESRAMDRYVTLGEGEPERLLSNLYFWTWNTQEVLDLVKWMRAYNVRVGAPRLRFVGFDMQSPHQAVDSILSTLTRLDAALGQRARTTVSCIGAARDASSGQYVSSRYLSGTTAAQRVACADSLSALTTTVTGRRAQWAAANPAEELDWVEQYVTLVRQWERMAASSNGSAERDKAMADNLLWVADKNPAARIFSWAHNYHVSRKPVAMGSYVGARLGAQYRVFGFTFGVGRLNAVGTNAGGLSGLQQHAVDAIDPSSLEAVFAATNQPRLIFDARRIASGGSAAATFEKALRMRSIGAVYSAATATSYFDQTLLPMDYDAVIWFANTTQSTLLPFR